MSLGPEQSNIFCNVNARRPYIKVVYNRVKPIPDSSTDISRYNDDIHNRLISYVNTEPDETEDYNEIEGIFGNLAKGYIQPEYTEQSKYIFLGNYSNEAETELQTISSNVIESKQNITCPSLGLK